MVRGGKGIALLFSALEVGGWSAPRPGRFTPGKDPVPIVQEAKIYITDRYFTFIISESILTNSKI
jgi:hypothetical protein